MIACPSRARCAPSLHALVVVALAATLASCSLTRPAPVKNTFLIAPAAPAAVAKPRPGTLRMGTVNVAVPFRGKAFVYRESDLKFVNDYYTEFLVPPAAMITEASARALDRAHVFERVAAPGAGVNADYVLDGFVESLYGDARTQKPSAEIAVTYYLSRADAASPFWSKEYRRSVPLSASTPDQYATALTSAFGEILTELVRDLSTAELK